MKQKKWFIISILYLLTISLQGQFHDDFSDGNFSENPEWEGDTGQFVVNGAQQLQLSGNESGKARLMTANPFREEEMEWRFFVKLSFSPSGNNNARVHLVANQPIMTLPNYFFRKIGRPFPFSAATVPSPAEWPYI